MARELAFSIATPYCQKRAAVSNGKMVPFSARSWKAVDDLHAAVRANGGVWDGAHGLPLWAFSG